MLRSGVAVFAAAALLTLVGGTLPAAGADPAQKSSTFTTETVYSPSNDDWEPAIATDAFGHVYQITTRYGAKPACRQCPEHFLVYRTSDDDGLTWGTSRYLCRCPGHPWQNDPEIVTDDRGRVYVAFLDGFHVAFQRSKDFGATWTHAREVDGNLLYSDKPTIAVSHDGRDVYVVFNADYRRSKSGKPYAVASHDGGLTWTEPVLTTDSLGLYWFSGGSAVLDDGTVVAAQDVYPQNNDGPIALYVLRSTDRGRHWTAMRMGTSGQQRNCPPHYGCTNGFLGAQSAVATDAAGRLYYLFNASSEKKGPAHVFLRTSSDGGATWSAAVRVDDERDAVDHEFPMVTAAGSGDVRIAWMDDRTGWWNTFYRRSIDGGRTWSHEARLSNAVHGAPYKSRRGFLFPYGDYGQLAVSADGMTQATWGEGPNYTGPGGTWYGRGI